MLVSTVFPDKEFEFAGNAVHVWHADLSGVEEGTIEPADILDNSERARASRLRVTQDRGQFIAAHRIARTLIGRYLGCTANMVRFGAAANGKPCLLKSSEQPDIRFNASRTLDHAVFGFALAREIGIDVECVEREAQPPALYRQALSARESTMLRAIGGERAQWEGFLALWVRKEAFLKARGDGLRLPVMEVEIVPATGQVFLSGKEQPNWRVRDIALDPRCVAAVSVEGPGWQVTSIRSCAA